MGEFGSGHLTPWKLPFPCAFTSFFLLPQCLFSLFGCHVTGSEPFSSVLLLIWAGKACGNITQEQWECLALVEYWIREAKDRCLTRCPFPVHVIVPQQWPSQCQIWVEYDWHKEHFSKSKTRSAQKSGTGFFFTLSKSTHLLEHQTTPRAKKISSLIDYFKIILILAWRKVSLWKFCFLKLYGREQLCPKAYSLAP